MKWSIIIPYYNLKPYTDELLDCLKPQMQDDMEVVVVDDGSKEPYTTTHDFVRIIRQDNGGVSKARNTGIDNTTGEYISFIDADDLVAADYVSQIMNKINREHFDYLEMSWNSLPGGAQWKQKLNSINDSLPNPSVCTRVFKRTAIGDLRFNEKKYSTEDDEFKRKLYYTLKGKKKAVITDYLYHYRTGVEDSKSKRFLNGEMKTKRIIYYYNHITKDMKYLIDEVAKEDQLNEVWVLTNQNDLPELEYYAHVKKPFKVRGMELRGEPYKDFEKIEQVLRTQVVIYIDKLNTITGISTWIYNFCQNMKDKKDILVVYNEMDSSQLMRLIPLVKIEKLHSRNIVCDVLIMCSVKNSIPKSIKYKKSVQIVHTCKNHLPLPHDRDMIVNVSQASKDSFKINSTVIPNFAYQDDKGLLLVSTARIGASDKGENDKRMVELARILNNHRVKYKWLYFADKALKDAPANMIRMQPTLDISIWISRADYIINLSDQEGFCYSIVEALQAGVPVITTDIKVLKEIGFKDNYNGYKLPFNFTDKDVAPIIDDLVNCSLKGFDYQYDNLAVADKWMEILGAKGPGSEYKFDLSEVEVIVKRNYKDMQLNQYVKIGQKFKVKRDRALFLCLQGLVDIC